MEFINQMPLLRLFISEYKRAFQNDVLRDNLVNVATLNNPISNNTVNKNYINFLKKTGVKQPPQFSKRESDVIDFLLNGYTASKIAHELSISSRTIESYMINLKNKHDCNSKTCLIQKLRKFEFSGLISQSF